MCKRMGNFEENLNLGKHVLPPLPQPPRVQRASTVFLPPSCFGRFFHTFPMHPSPFRVRVAVNVRISAGGYMIRHKWVSEISYH